MNLSRPVRKQGIAGKDIGGETLLYDVEGDAIHALNPTAKLIWELCDGNHSIEDMELSLRDHFSVGDAQDVSGDIRRSLEIFAEKSLLQDLT